MLFPTQTDTKKVKIFRAISEKMKKLVEFIDGGECEFDEIGILRGEMTLGGSCDRSVSGRRGER